MEKISLNGSWELRGQKQNSESSELISLVGQVPGCVQLDLSREGYLPSDLFYAENITKAEAFESYEWWYERKFFSPKNKSNVFLVFEGVDCLAEYFLNGNRIGESKNAFIPHEFRIDKYLSDGENTLFVHIKSPIVYAYEEDYPLRLLQNNNAESTHLRKAAHSFGWDIFPRAVTSGLWRGVSLEIRDEIYFSQLFIKAGVDQRALLCYQLNLNGNDCKGIELEIVGSCDDSTLQRRVSVKSTVGRFSFQIEKPKLWFPYGYGEANVYDCFARIYRDGTLLHECPVSFGIRDVEFERRDPDGNDDGQFRFLINGVEVMCRGSNWVPLDAFNCRAKERYEKALALVKDIGCNILRSWGGGVYEEEEFFDFCDRNGIMVWQDFSMACAQYPENAEFLQSIREEATFVIRKLRNHPSIIIWAGDNEIDACYPQYNPNDNKITRQILPECVRDNDLGRPYLPSSPYISEKMYSLGFKSQQHGTALVEEHLWGPRDYFKSDFYSQSKAHFVSETGYHGCPSLESIKKFISAEKVWPYHNNSEWILHSSDRNSNPYRVTLMEKQIRQLFGFVPTEPEDYILASQISQAEAKKYFIERIRVGRPKKTGIIWWNLLDGWPQMSDAVVDYYFEKKLAYGYIKRSQAPFTVAAGEISNWSLPIYACNDTLKEISGHITVKDGESEKILYSADFSAKANASTLLTKLPIYYSDTGMLIFEWETDGERAFNHYLCYHPPVSFDFYKKMLEKYRL